MLNTQKAWERHIRRVMKTVSGYYPLVVVLSSEMHFISETFFLTYGEKNNKKVF